MRPPLVTLLLRQAGRIGSQQRVLSQQAHLIAGLSAQLYQVGALAEQAVARAEQLSAQVEALMEPVPNDIEGLL